jgi:hypothetical protein
MSPDDLKKLATGSVLFSLDRIITPRLINVLYLLGLATIALWAVNHLFSTFAFGFGAGLWGLLEIGVFGLLGFVILRVICETLIVFFKANEKAADAATRPYASANLLDEVRDAIEDLAEQEDSGTVALPSSSSRAKSSASSVASAKMSTGEPASAPRRPVRRTAKRSPARTSTRKST